MAHACNVVFEQGNNACIRDNAVRVILTLKPYVVAPTFGFFIEHVFPMRSLKEMVRVNACRVVTAVTDGFPFSYGAFVYLIGNSMRGKLPPLVYNDSVAFPLGSGPVPATGSRVYSIVLENVMKTFDQLRYPLRGFLCKKTRIRYSHNNQ